MYAFRLFINKELSNDFSAILEEHKILEIINIPNEDGHLLLASDGKILKLGDNEVFGNRVSVRINEKCEESNIVNKIFISNLISFDNIKGNICVRNRRTGDKITINGINKSVKKLFIDKKIPKEFFN